jgi:hypothetical protein
MPPTKPTPANTLTREEAVRRILRTLSLVSAEDTAVVLSVVQQLKAPVPVQS